MTLAASAALRQPCDPQPTTPSEAIAKRPAESQRSADATATCPSHRAESNRHITIPTATRPTRRQLAKCFGNRVEKAIATAANRSQAPRSAACAYGMPRIWNCSICETTRLPTTSVGDNSRAAPGKTAYVAMSARSAAMPIDTTRSVTGHGGSSSRAAVASQRGGRGMSMTFASSSRASSRPIPQRTALNTRQYAARPMPWASRNHGSSQGRRAEVYHSRGSTAAATPHNIARTMPTCAAVNSAGDSARAASINHTPASQANSMLNVVADVAWQVATIETAAASEVTRAENARTRSTSALRAAVNADAARVLAATP